jgi:transposase
MDMTMSSIRPNRMEVVTSVQRRRRWTPEQKLEIVKQTNEPGSSVSMVARQHGLTAAQLFQWRKAYLEGSLVAVGTNQTVVPDSELQEAMRRIKLLEGALGRKTLEKTRFSRGLWTLPKQKSGLCARLYCPGTSNKGGVPGTGRIAQQRIDQENAFI